MAHRPRAAHALWILALLASCTELTAISTVAGDSRSIGAVLPVRDFTNTTASRTSQRASAPRRKAEAERTIWYAFVTHRGDRAIIFWRIRKGAGWRVEVSIVDFAQRHETVIDSGNIGLVPDGEWSPDDRFYAATAQPPKSMFRAGILDARTGRWRPIRRVLGVKPVATSVPSWSPDGKHILLDAYVRNLGREETLVCLYSVSTRSAIPAAVGSKVKCGNSFLGRQFVFMTKSGIEGEDLRYRFFVRGIRRFGTNPYHQVELMPDRFIRKVMPSPKGNAVAAFCRTRSSKDSKDAWDLRLVTDMSSPDGRSLSTSQFDPNCLEWSSDGSRILVALRQAAEDEPPRLAVVDVRSGAIRALSDSRGTPIQGAQVRWVDHDRRLVYQTWADHQPPALWCYVWGTGVSYELWPGGTR